MHSKTGFYSINNMSKSTYQRRKEQGVCVKCGKNNSRKGRCMCEKCAEKSKKYTKESKDFYRKNGICYMCGKNKLFGNKKTCPECLAKAVEATKKSDLKRIDSVKQYRKEYWLKRKKYLEENNLCRSCGTRKRAEGRTYCSICLIKHREREKNNRKILNDDFLDRSERPNYGLCYFCNSPIDRDGRACTKCANIMKNNLPEYRDNQYWRNDNKLVFMKKENTL